MMVKTYGTKARSCEYALDLYLLQMDYGDTPEASYTKRTVADFSPALK